MKNQILTLIEAQEYKKAAGLFIKAMESEAFDDTYAILGAYICRALGDYVGERRYIERGIAFCPTNYELFMMLGDYYQEENADCAYLCYENAHHFAKYSGSTEDAAYIAQCIENLRANCKLSVNPASIVILSYNTLEMTKDCINSIRKHYPQSSYELVIVDNASTDGSLEWLREQDDIVLVANENNEGFPRGCNIGIAASKPENDILLLNSDTIVTQNSLFTLRMGLYSSSDIGASGSISNEGENGQCSEEAFDTIEEYLEYAATSVNIPRENALEYKAWLIGYCLLIKRNVLDEVGLLDEIFTPGNFEDDDLCLRIGLAGYRNVLCHNSLIFHYGHGSFNKDYNPAKFSALFFTNKDKFEKKWQGLDPVRFGYQMPGVVGAIKHKKDACINILEIGCQSGNDLTKLKYLYPNAKVFGTEKNETLCKIASLSFPCANIDAESEPIPFDDELFDYVFLNEAFEEFNDVDLLIQKYGERMRAGGSIVRLHV